MILIMRAQMYLMTVKKKRRRKNMTMRILRREQTQLIR